MLHSEARNKSSENKTLTWVIVGNIYLVQAFGQRGRVVISNGVVNTSVQFPKRRQGSSPHPDHEGFVVEAVVVGVRRIQLGDRTAPIGRMGVFFKDGHFGRISKLRTLVSCPGDSRVRQFNDGKCAPACLCATLFVHEGKGKTVVEHGIGYCPARDDDFADTTFFDISVWIAVT